MSVLLSTLRWDLLIQARYQIITVMWAVAGLYLLVFWAVPAIATDQVLAVLIFSDPALLGLTFIGALLLFEQGENTLQALVVTPIERWQYLWSKALSLALMATPPAILMAGIGHGWAFNYPLLILGTFLSSLLYTFAGIAMVARSQSLNGYIIRVALCSFPLGLPLLNLFGVTDTWLWYVIPSQATLSLLMGSFGHVPGWELLYGFGYLILWIAAMYALAQRAFERQIVGRR
jgi:fluoroquinolone transport system permease protein